MKKTLKVKTIPRKISVPGSKSHGIRAICLSLFARSVSTIFNLNECEDVKACLQACRILGATTERKGDALILDSRNLNDEKDVEIDCRNSGTVLFFLTALCSSLRCKVSFTGDESLGRRSAQNLLKALGNLGVRTTLSGSGIPYSVYGPITGGETEIDCPTSQFLSALLLACPLARNDCTVKVSSLNEKPYVEMTKQYLKKQKIAFSETDGFFTVQANQKYRGMYYSVPGDYSCAAVFFAAAAITGSQITVSNLLPQDIHPDREILTILKRMGCGVKTDENSVTLSGPEHLKGIDMDLNSMPDSLPVLAVVACFADSPVRIFNVAHARIKETDRIHIMAENLKALGADVCETDDGLMIEPVREFVKAEVDSFNDHRIAMAMAVASLKCRDGLTVDNAECVCVSFPDFYNVFEGAL